MLFAAVLLPVTRLCYAQGPPPNAAIPPDVRDLREMLEHVSHDAREKGPLLVVAPKTFSAKRVLPPKERRVPSLRVVAAAAGRVVLQAGTVTVLAPEHMMVITANPGKANLFAGTNLLPPFLATLTPEQWQMAGSSRGISRADLTADQQALYDGILPDAARVVTNRLEAYPEGPTGRKRGWIQVGEIVRYERSTVRLRLRLNTRYRFYSTDGKDSFYNNHLFMGHEVGDVERSLVGESYDKPNDPNDEESQILKASKLHGVPLLQRVPGRPKPSQLAYAAPALNVLIPLTADLKTVKDVLTAVGQHTGLELLADRRVAGLPLYLRAAPNQGARARDLLMALARGINGTYRRMEERTFLLTDDIEGIGTRFARLAFWMRESAEKKRELQEQILASVGKQAPLRYLKFDTGAQGALPDDLRRKVAENWTQPKSDGFVSLPSSDLPTSVRRDMERYRREYAEQDKPIYLDGSRVKISLAMDMVFVLPDGSEAEPSGNFKTGIRDFLDRMMAAAKEEVYPPPIETPSLPAPNPVTRGVLLSAPTTAEEARELVTTVKRCGGTELWVSVPLKGSEPPDTLPLTAAVAAGKQEGIPVYAVVSLLRGQGIGTPEQNILGQDGDTLAQDLIAFYSRLYADRKDHAMALAAVKRRIDNYRGWLTPDADIQAIREKQILQIVAVPGLTGITLRDTAAPGYLTDFEGESMLEVNGNLGYTPAQRLAFLREKGYDPIDIVSRWDFSAQLPFFPTSAFMPRFEVADEQSFMATPIWLQFRAARNQEMLSALYTRLKKVSSAFACYIETSYGSYISTEITAYRNWDVVDRLPRKDIYEIGRTTLRQEPVSGHTLIAKIFRPGKTETKMATLQFTDQRLRIIASGLIFDMSELPVADVLRRLDGVRLFP